MACLLSSICTFEIHGCFYLQRGYLHPHGRLRAVLLQPRLRGLHGQHPLRGGLARPPQPHRRLSAALPALQGGGADPTPGTYTLADSIIHILFRFGFNVTNFLSCVEILICILLANIFPS